MWECKKCGKTFEEKPLEHGDLIITFDEKNSSKRCDGEIVHVSKPFYSVDANCKEGKE